MAQARQTTTKLKIISGPSKFDLMTSLFVRAQMVWFTVSEEGKYGFSAKVISVASSPENDAGLESDVWLIEIRAKNNEIFLHDAKLRGWYSTKPRKGALEFVKGE